MGIRGMESDHKRPVRKMNHLMFTKTAKDSMLEKVGCSESLWNGGMRSTTG